MENNPEKLKRKPKIRNGLLSLFIVLVIFTMIEFRIAGNDNNLDQYLFYYTEMVYPDFSGNGGGVGFSSHAVFQLKTSYQSGPVYITGHRYFFSEQLFITKPLPEKTFFPYDFKQSIDLGLADRILNAETASLDITFKTVLSIEETKALAAAYGAEIMWMPFDTGDYIQLGLSNLPEKSDAEIRSMFLTLILNEKYVNGHADFKEAVNTIFRHDFRMIGFRVVGSSKHLLNLLKDPMIKTFRIDKLNGIDIQK